MFAHSTDAAPPRWSRAVLRRRSRPPAVREAVAEHVRGRRHRARRGRRRRDGLTLVNTLLGFGIDAESRRPLLGDGGGGYSGPPIKPVALRVVHDVTRALPGHADHRDRRRRRRGEDAVEMLLAGASAVGVGTVTFREPRAMLRIHDELDAWCAERGRRPRRRSHRGAGGERATMTTDGGAARGPGPAGARPRRRRPRPQAEAIATRLAPWFGIAKVGYELYGEAGPVAFDRLARPRIPRLLRPQAARHPEHRRARGAARTRATAWTS